MDGGSLKIFLETVMQFLQANPYEVVTLLFVNTGPPLKDWAAAYYETGADLVSYSPPANKRHGKMRIKDWPTIAEMIESNVRLVTFLSHGAKMDEASYLLPEYGYLFETDFGIGAPDQYTCHPSRPPQPPGSHIPDRLSLVNHFLYARFFGISVSSRSFHNEQMFCFLTSTLPSSTAHKLTCAQDIPMHRTPTQPTAQASTLANWESMLQDAGHCTTGVRTSSK